MIRAVREDDLRFVRKTWRDSYSTSAWAEECTPPPQWEETGKAGGVYWHGHKLIIDSLIASSVVLVDEAPDGLLDGWACGFPRTLLHYVYVRLSARKRGVARRLLDGLELRAGKPVQYTHRTHAVRRAPDGWTGYGWIPKRERHSMAKRRVSFISLNTGYVIPFKTEHGNVELKSSLRAADKFVAYVDDARKIVEVQCWDRGRGKLGDGGKPGIQLIDLSACTQLLVYPEGEGPDQEKAAEAPPAPAKAS